MREASGKAVWRWVRWAALLLAVSLGVCCYWYWDRPVAEYFKQQTGLKPAAKMLTELGDSIWYLPTSLLAFLVLRYAWRAPLWSRRFGFIFLTVGGSGLLVLVSKVLLGRARPKEWFENQVYGFHPFQFQFDSHFQAFPSGHATTCMALACALWFCWPRAGWLLLPLGIALAFTRVIVNAHYPSDIVGGMVLGAFTACMFKAWFERRAWALHAATAENQSAAALTPDAMHAERQA